MCFGSSNLCSRQNTAHQLWRWQCASARYARSGSSWPGQTLREPSSLSLVWQTWVPLPVLPHSCIHMLHIHKHVCEIMTILLVLLFKSKQDSVITWQILSITEFLQWGGVVLRDDNAQDWEEPAGPRPQELHSAGNTCSKTKLGEGTQWHVTWPYRHQDISQWSDVFTVKNKQSITLMPYSSISL